MSSAEAKKTKATKAAVKGNGAARHYNLSDIITVLAGENPKQQGSAARKRFALYKTG